MGEVVESMSCCLWLLDFLAYVAGNSESSGDGKRPWGKQTCERSTVGDQLLTYWGPRLQSTMTQKKLSEITYRFYPPYSKRNILPLLESLCSLGTIIQSKIKYV